MRVNMPHALGLRDQPPYHTTLGHGKLGWQGLFALSPVGSGAMHVRFTQGGPWDFFHQ